MLILITNDDGINAQGINTLAKEVGRVADVLLVAPDREQSASSHSFTMNRPLRLNKLGENRYSCDGTPTDCVMMATHGVLKHKLPDLLLSGINHGSNMGEDITYSGTVSAAIEGSILGIPSIAISNTNAGNIYSYKPAAKFIAEFIKQMDKLTLPTETFLNINFPILTDSRYTKYKFTIPGKRIYNDIIIEKTDPRGKNYYWIAGEAEWKEVKGSDFEAVSEGYVSISPLRVNFADDHQLDQLRNIKLDF